MSRILVVEDEAIIRQSVRRLLQRHHYEVTDLDSIDAAREHDLSTFDLVITDLRLPGGQGTDLIELAGTTPVLIMTSFASLRSAVDAMKMGAVEYIAKPFDHGELVEAVKSILDKARQSLTDTSAVTASQPAPAQTSDSNKAGHNDATDISRNNGIIGSCDAMQKLFRKISKVAPTNATVMINGESGTGKELVAKALHNQSHRAAAQLISVNCAAIPETLLESELFGHEKGAFTGAASQRQGLVEAANGGTLFLDEIGELPLEAQARLLRVLQESEIRRVGAVQSIKVDVRLIAATHRNLKEMAACGEFREDLYYRLNVVELILPPLRERGDDVIELASFILTRACEKLGQPPMQFDSGAIASIKQYQWPGNVRELENAVERSVILAEDQYVSAELLGIDLSPDRYISSAMRENLIENNNNPATAERAEHSDQGDLSLDDYFVHFVLENEAKMTETDLARKLGISRKSLWERRQRLGIPRKKK
ncbi:MULTISPECIES: sigma-54 dependent transcriptional regulator [unclassified Oceanobacter]|uniref:sigma-54-dependent transcriptional regulator n=1 Tax=unclassified Oceanobacter TaxID=2620260 RepID=UPI0027373501|nr:MULTISPECIES: sigma-54 dependent transcriptional regulator [unclassified Oceanobacter]MDP2506527.1 sigma-54 dependent transcriptional regulator [Oceanobacter sp. 3_MG-2023]MDP2549089.1 sigma-54 dependent transcriptional regulator [Oceanobacter sp. 4_MG-2023]MDP2609488.1 sigma-54 dependent transcriptional regulator [Oceanobacter sp. 1_MG-2023]MDP2612812.1 sigma-54 dependent transcriptional regulator [Oceanobacter sp. 2_MG-2023]